MRYNQQCSSKTQNSMALLGGALLGAAAMYLLDPEAGRRRRHHLSQATGDALGRAGEAVGPTLESLRERAADMGSRLGERASHLGSTLAGGAASLGSRVGERAGDAGSATASAAGTAYEGASDWLSNLGESLGSVGRRFTKGARSYGHSAADSARDYRDSAWESARDYSSRAYRGARNLTPWTREEETHYGAYTAAGISAAVLGAAAIYLFDPTQGRTRRKLAIDQAHKVLNDTSRCMHRTGRYVHDMLNRSRGVAHEARTRFASRGEPVPPETLMQRVRSEMGHVVTNAHAISVMVNNEGDVTLTGRVLGTELDALLTTVNKVPGVNQIINRLDVQDTPEAVAGGDAGQHAGQRL